MPECLPKIADLLNLNTNIDFSKHDDLLSIEKERLEIEKKRLKVEENRYELEKERVEELKNIVNALRSTMNHNAMNPMMPMVPDQRHMQNFNYEQHQSQDYSYVYANL